MRFFTSVILIAVLSALTTSFMPWWMIAVVSFIISFVIHLSSGKAFLSGFLGIAVCWLVFILKIDGANEHILSGRMANLFHLPNYAMFIVANLIIGGLVGGLAAWSGAALRNGFMAPRSN